MKGTLHILIAKNLQNKISKLEIEKSNLTKMSCKGLINDGEFVKQKNDYEKEINILKQKLVDVKNQANQNDELIKKVKFAIQARENFNKGGIKVKKDILSGLGTNQTLKDRKLHILAHKWMVPIENDLKGLEAKFATLELGKGCMVEAKNPAYARFCRELRGVWDDVGTLVSQNMIIFNKNILLAKQKTAI